MIKIFKKITLKDIIFTIFAILSALPIAIGFICKFLYFGFELGQIIFDQFNSWVNDESDRKKT